MSHNVDVRPSLPVEFVSEETLSIVRNFPPAFRWGAATASYQIEGGTDLDGRGVSIWDTFAATPGKVVNAENGSVACGHYHRFREDIAMMKDLGLQTYRFSIAWPRLFPNGDHASEPRGFDFYNRLIDALLEADIEPLATLYHWDLPQVLQDKDGWASRDIVGEFTDYTLAVVAAYGDRVKSWVTLNEPWVFTWLGYMNGVHAPGVQNLDHAIAASHHTALAHAEATRAIRSLFSDARTGFAANMTNYRVDDPNNPELVELSGLMDAHINRWWLDAAFNGTYPQNLVDLYGDKLQRVVLDGDMDKLQVNNEFLGINYYSDSFITTPKDSDRPMHEGGLFPFPQRAGGETPEPRTDMGWPITPHGLGDLALRISRDWPQIPSISVTENGAAFPDGPDENGQVDDVRRVDYLEKHLKALGSAIAEGAPVHSYYTWSLMDNYEWAEGYAKRFGIVHVDFDTLVRTPKRSAYTYSSLISAHGDYWSNHVS